MINYNKQKGEPMMQPKLRMQSIVIPFPCEPFEVVGNSIEGDELHIAFEEKGEAPECPECGGRMHVHQHRTVRLRALPVDRYKVVWWDVGKVVWRCPECGLCAGRSMPFRYPGSRMTVPLAKEICGRIDDQGSTVGRVARDLRLGWDAVKDVHKRFLREVERRRPRPSAPQVCVVDEFSIRRGHTYATLVIDGRTKEPLHLAEGNTKESFEPFFSLYGEEFYEGIGAFAMDQNAQYDRVAKERLPSAPCVSDPFHMLKNYSDQVLDKVRLRAARGFRSDGDMDSYRLFKRGKGLEKMDRPDRESDGLEAFLARRGLRRLMELNKDMDTAVHMRDSLRWMYANCRTREDMEKRWDAWVAMAKESGIKELASYASNKDRYYRENILAHAEHPVSSGVIEGCMNRIKVLKRTAFGFRDTAYFFLRIKYMFLPQSVRQPIWNAIWTDYGCPDLLPSSHPLEQQKTG